MTGRTRKVIKASYGRMILLKRFCPWCKRYAIVVEDKFCCCGKSVGDWNGEFKIRHKRESEVPGKKIAVNKRDKKRILEHQNYQCLYCGARLGGRGVRVEYDHFIPFAFSGDNSRFNMVASCGKCNRLKSAFLFSSVEEARVHILNEREQHNLPCLMYHGGSYEVSKI